MGIVLKFCLEFKLPELVEQAHASLIVAEVVVVGLRVAQVFFIANVIVMLLIFLFCLVGVF